MSRKPKTEVAAPRPTIKPSIPVMLGIEGQSYTVLAVRDTSKYGAPMLRLSGKINMDGNPAQLNGYITAIGYVPEAVKAERRAEREKRIIERAQATA